MKRFNAGFFCMLLIAVVILPLRQSNAENNSIEYTGNQLIKTCNQHNYEQQNTEWDFCVIYIIGVSNGIQYGVAYGYAKGTDKPFKDESPIVGICFPKNATSEQAALIVTKYLSDNPAALNERDAILIYKALKQGWPCR